MSNIITDLLASPPWVIGSFFIIYTLVMSFLIWKIAVWYKGIAGWNKQRTSEKTWKDKVTKLEKENATLRKQLEQAPSSESED